jgi:succinate dehydrogenase/fumarate reductase flavoprotein subunit
VITPEEVIRVVQEEMHPYDKNYWRNGPSMQGSLDRFEHVWCEVSGHYGYAPQETDKATARAKLRAREAVALLATSRWVYASALERTESRGLHRRTDFPDLDPAQGQHIISGGLDKPYVRRVPHLATLTLAEEALA